MMPSERPPFPAEICQHTQLTQNPLEAGTNIVSEPEAFVRLPERKTIRRIVIHSPNLMAFEVFARNRYDAWEKMKEIKRNEDDVIDLRVKTYTDGIRLRVQKTRDGKNASIHEIKLYGYANRD